MVLLHGFGTNKSSYCRCLFRLNSEILFSVFLLLPNITDIINVLNVKCNFIAFCLLWQNMKAGVLISSLWKHSKVFYFRDSCIFYLISSSPLWKEAEESKNTFTLCLSAANSSCYTSKLRKHWIEKSLFLLLVQTTGLLSYPLSSCHLVCKVACFK